MSHREGQASEYATAAQEARWIAKAQRGEEVAFTRLVEAYQRPVYNLCYRMLGNPREAEDAAQEVFLRAYLKLETYDPARKFSSWLLSIASHYCIDRLRRRRMKLVSWDELPPWRWLPDTAPQPEEAMLAAEASQEVRALLDTLAPDYRAAVVLRYWHEMSYEEIAGTLDTTVSAIKSKLFRARRMMAEVARQREAEPATGNVTLAGSPS
ncbi:MAG: sigma-70 family RNA polymerase sigma factor [Caldilineae bacterium]|nr:MAG: sigma-70 family RNA polymerase sigma factor [Caldilineae bacterium]